MASSRTASSEKRWWHDRFWSVMESIGLAKRLERGKRYARAERVLAIEVTPGLVTAHVQGSRYEPYEAELEVRTFTDEQWERAVASLASQAIYSAKLLAGEMPESIEEVFASEGLSLFPASTDDLTMRCTCPDAVAPCKHIAALHYVLADKLDADPFLLFRLRGCPRERLLRELRHHRAAEASGQTRVAKAAATLEDSIDRYWKMGDAVKHVPVAIEPPNVSASLLKRLGMPSFWKSHPEIRGSLVRLYAKVTERAMALAFSGRDRDGDETD